MTLIWNEESGLPFRAAKYERAVTSTRRVMAKSHITTQTREGNTSILMTFVSGCTPTDLRGRLDPSGFYRGSRMKSLVHGSEG